MVSLFLTSTRLFLIVSKSLTKAYYDGCRLSSKTLAEIYNTNPRSLIPMLNRLTRVGYLSSKVGGLNPGHIFTRDPKQISVGEIIVALEGKLEMVGCDSILRDVKSECTPENRCKFCKVVADYIEQERKERSAISMYDLYADSLRDTEIDE